MIKKYLKRLLAVGLAAAMALPAAVPTAVEAKEPSIEGHGLTGAWYKAKEGGREDIARFTFEKELYLGSVKTANLDGENLRPLIADLIGSGDDSQFVLASFTGELDVPKEEEYTFYITGDDGFRLYVDGEQVIDFWYQRWEQEQKSEPITLTAGRHDICVEYLQGWGGAWIRMEWESPSVARQVIPEDVLYQKKESYYQDAKDMLEIEIEKCQRASQSIHGSQESIEALNASIESAIEVRDRDYSDVADTDAVIGLMNQAAEALRNAMTAVYLSTGVQEAGYHTQFMNPLYQGQDPFIAQKDGFYYFVASSNDDSESKVYVSKSRTLTDQGEKKLVMDLGGKQRRVFAPELFFLNDAEGGHWYIYYCADVLDCARDYPEVAAKYELRDHHIACCLRSKTQDPMGEYEDIGPLYCGEDGKIWGANDITVVEYDGALFAIWGTIGENQPLGPAIVEMDTPSSITKDRSMLPIGGGEGPRALKNADGDLFITTSEGGYSTDGYRLSILCFTGDKKEQILDADKWYAKRDVFTSTTNVSGPARACFVKSADGTEDWMVYHSRVYKEVDDNWWRQVNIKKFGWNEDGTPDFGTPASTNRKYALPSGDPGQGLQYEAENAILEGGASVQGINSNYYGEGYVHVPNSRGPSVSFVVEAEEAGDYIVGLRYAYGLRKDGETTNRPSSQLPARASMNISVNGKQAGKIAMDKNSITWSEWFTGSNRLALKKGANVISYSVGQGCTGNVCLDALTMYRADVPYTEAEIRPESVLLEKDYAILQEGESVQIAASILPGNAGNQKLSYHSDNEEAAVVNEGGQVTAQKEGKAAISVSAVGNKQASAEFTVFVVKKVEDSSGATIKELQEALKKAEEAQKAAEEEKKAAEKRAEDAEKAKKEAEAERIKAEEQAKASKAEKEKAEKAAKKATEQAQEAAKLAEAAQKALKAAQKAAESAKKTAQALRKELQQLKGTVKKGQVFNDGILKYKVTNAEKKTVSVVGSAKKNASSVNVKATVTYAGKSFKITAVAKNAFKNNKKLAKVVIGNQVTTIGSNAFYGNTKLKSVVIGKKVAKIEGNAFCKDSKLKKVTVKSNVLKAVGKGAFKGIHKKAYINVPNKKAKAYRKLFKNAGQPKSVTIK